MAKLLYQGHGSMRLTSRKGMVIYIDPYCGEGYDQPADLILVTHQHRDHNQIQLPKRKTDCRLIQNTDGQIDGTYQHFIIKEAYIEAVEAYNHKHPKTECVGYLVRLDGLLLYFAGDTGPTAQMGTFAASCFDYAFLPTDGIYTMNVQEAMRCAAVIGAKHTVPIHMAPGQLFDEEIAQSFKAAGAMLWRPGEEKTL